MSANVCVYAVRGIGGLKNVAKRNVKPDLLVTVHRYKSKLRNINFITTLNPGIE